MPASNSCEGPWSATADDTADMDRANGNAAALNASTGILGKWDEVGGQLGCGVEAGGTGLCVVASSRDAPRTRRPLPVVVVVVVFCEL